MEGLFNPFSSWLIVTIISVMAACEVITKRVWGSISLSNITCFDERNEVRKEEIENVFRKELKLA